MSLSCYCLRPGTRPIGRKHPRQKRTRHSKPAGFAVARGKFDDFWGGHNHPSEQSYYLPVDSHALATEFNLQRSLLGSMSWITRIPHSQMKRARTDVTGSSLETEGSVNETASIHLHSLPLAIVHKSRAACRIRGSGRITRARTARLTSPPLSRTRSTSSDHRST